MSKAKLNKIAASFVQAEEEAEMKKKAPKPKKGGAKKCGSCGQPMPAQETEE